MDILSRFCLVYFICVLCTGLLLTLTGAHVWLFRLKRWVLLTVAGSMVLALGIAIYGLASQAERSELTFEVEDGKDYVWPHVPLRVYSPPGDGYLEWVETAMKILNRSVKCDLFVGEATMTAAQVRVRAFDGLPCGKPFRDQHGVGDEDGREGVWDCLDGTNEVLLNNPGDIETGTRGVLHGLGHVVRLAHDPGGIMAKGIHALPILLPNDKDVAALRERYCKPLR